MDKADINFETTMRKNWVNDTIAMADSYKKDSNRKQRLDENLCIYCYTNSGGMSGQAFTDRDCNSCGITMSFSDTNTDELCPTCAKDNKLCKHCGSDIDLKKRK